MEEEEGKVEKKNVRKRRKRKKCKSGGAAQKVQMGHRTPHALISNCSHVDLGLFHRSRIVAGSCLNSLQFKAEGH